MLLFILVVIHVKLIIIVFLKFGWDETFFNSVFRMLITLFYIVYNESKIWYIYYCLDILHFKKHLLKGFCNVEHRNKICYSY
jgi:hypothetical protein